MVRTGLIAAAFAFFGSAAAIAADLDFNARIAPIFREHCLKCHGPEKQKGGVRLDVRDGVVRKADSGAAAVIAGKSTESELIRRVQSPDQALRMPPAGDRLTAAQIETLQKWIDAGAVWPDAGEPKARGEMAVTDDDRRHWSFQPLPKSDGDVDRWVTAALIARGLTPSPRASPAKLVRRIYFDIVGLPPSPEEVAAFESAAAASADNAVAELVDRLLASRHYGERWSRHWLDVARYADSNGQEADQDRPFAYQYRDFVIKAFNDDLPYDTFVAWQIAGDELAPDQPLAVAATGFLSAGPHTVLDVPMEEEKIRNRYNELDDVLATLGSGMLGLTLGCARCHDHKYDAIPTRDYYRLLAAVNSGDRREVPLGTRAEIEADEQQRAEWNRQVKEAERLRQEWLARERKPVEERLRREKIAALAISEEERKLLLDQPNSDAGKKLAKQHEKSAAVSEGEVQAALTEEQREAGKTLAAEIARIKTREPPALPRAFAFRDFGPEPKPTWLFHRADFYDKSEPVQLGFLQVLSQRPAERYWEAARAASLRRDSTQQRAALARWLTDVDTGAGALLARVFVNRVWKHHFGEGLVRTPSDFGLQGERPTHPELLDQLARDFVDHGWKVKRLQRQILVSATYLQDSAYRESAAKIDPDNRLLHRRRPQRLEAEILRDAMLSAAGTLNLEPYGPAFKPPISPEAMVARNLKTPYNAEPADSPNLRRRSIYMFHKRVVPYPLLQAFDRPDALQSCGRRDATTVAPQALAVLNDPFVRDRAREFADRLLRAPDASVESVVRSAFQIACSRSPTEPEQVAATTFIRARCDDRRARDKKGADSVPLREAVTDFCQAVFGLNEFLYID